MTTSDTPTAPENEKIWQGLFSAWDITKAVLSVFVILVVLALLFGWSTKVKVSAEALDKARSDFCWNTNGGFDKYIIRDNGLYCWNTGNGKIWLAEPYLQAHADQFPGLAAKKKK
jgi:hypothetical protein